MMNILLLVLLVALVVVYAKRDKNPEQSRVIMTALAVLVFALLGVRWVRGCRDDASVAVLVGREFQTAAGYKIGRQVANVVPGGGTILVMQMDTSTGLSRAQADGISRGAGRAFRVVADSVEFSDEEDMMMMEGMMLNVEMLEDFLARNPNADAVVSCLGLPFGRRGVSFPEGAPPFFTLEVPEPGLVAQLMRQGVLHGCLIYKDDIDWSARPARGMSLEDIFDMRFILVTPENYRSVL